MADAAVADPPPVAEENGEVDEEGEWDGEYEEEDDEEDIDAEAAEIARRLEEQLWADIQANSASASAPEAPATTATPTTSTSQFRPALPESHQKDSPDAPATVATVRAILAALEHDALAKSTFAAAPVPEFTGATLLDILRNIAASGRIPPGVALPISRAVILLAKNNALFGSLKHSDVPALSLKRKREEGTGTSTDTNERASKRVNTGESLQTSVTDAVRAIIRTLPLSQKADPALVASIKPHLQRVFRFAASSGPAPGTHPSALQEISSMIQVLGVLNGVQIDAATPGDAGEGEETPSATVVAGLQTTVLALHALLQTHVASALAAVQKTAPAPALAPPAHASGTAPPPVNGSVGRVIAGAPGPVTAQTNGTEAGGSAAASASATPTPTSASNETKHAGANATSLAQIAVLKTDIDADPDAGVDENPEVDGEEEYEDDQLADDGKAAVSAPTSIAAAATDTIAITTATTTTTGGVANGAAA